LLSLSQANIDIRIHKLGIIERYPNVSLLIAIRNEAYYIHQCLKSIFNQDYPTENLEVYILDGESTDKSWQIVEQLIQGRSNFHLVTNHNITQSNGWNLGIQLSKGEIIGIVSGHAELGSDYVSQAVSTLMRTGANLVGCPVRAISQTWIGRAIAEATSTPFGVGGARFRYTNREEWVDTAYMGMCWRELYLRIGGFDQELVKNQDDELSYRLREQGGKVICDPAIYSHYHNRSTIHSLWRQYFLYGLWKVRVLQKHTRQMRARQFVPPTFVAGLLGSGLAGIFWTPAHWLFLAVLVSYLFVNLVASLWTAWRKGWKYLPLLPLVYLILHLSYGLGFLAGLVKFWNRWSDKLGIVPLFGDSQLPEPHT
jgi:glycosyltransferase involved in cell wall biosynthesis